MDNFIIAVDIGTQGTKAILFDTDLNIIASAFEGSRLIRPKPGVVWQEADDILSSCVNTLKSLSKQAGEKAKKVCAIGIDSQMAGIMGVAKDGLAATYYDSWLDTRCEPQMKAMREKAGQKVTAITGGPITYTHGPKILWWKENEPQIYYNIAKFVLPHAYVVGRLASLNADSFYFDYTCIQYSGFGDNKNLCWSDELLYLFGIDKNKLPRIVSPYEVVGRLNEEFAKLTCLPSGIPIIAGGGDTASSIFGSGIFDPGTLYDCAGTASVMCSVTDKYIPDTDTETLTMMRSPIDGYWFPLAYINGGGLCLRWVRDNFTGSPNVSYSVLEKECESIPPGSEGLIFIPHFAGRVLPNNPYIRGSFAGLDWKHTRAHLFRASMEGIAYEYHYYLSVLKSLYPNCNFSKMYAAGGGAKSALFNKIKADVLGVSVLPFEMSDAALVGSAVLAGLGTGLYDDYRVPIGNSMKISSEIKPDPDNTTAYEPYTKDYLKLIDTLTPYYANTMLQ
ncbi:MAG: hypothetical protein LBQ95_04365 [Lachnospiraceae bacterium]|jgi:xylulokinase|nr:hypothetical protein [Lachnospiraceae bacterium]